MWEVLSVKWEVKGCDFSRIDGAEAPEKGLA